MIWRIDLKVYIDLDGVLVDFVSGIRKYFGINKKWPAGQWEVAKALGIDPERLDYLMCKEEFWAGLKPTVEFDRLVALLARSFGYQRLAICTTPHKNHVAGKYEWIRKYAAWAENNVIFARDKSFYAEPKSILIDDKTSTILEFRSRGGIGILFPRPWNVLADVDDPITFLEGCLSGIQCLSDSDLRLGSQR